MNGLKRLEKQKLSSLRPLKQNAILQGVEGPDAAAILATGELVELPIRGRIYTPGEPIREAFFPLDAVLSVVTQMKDGHAIEVGTIGREGVSAIPLLLGGNTAANECYSQVPGKAISMSAELFRQLASANAEFRQSLDRFLQAYVNMLGQLAGCNGLHSIRERCARWLLMTHDRVSRDEISLTQEYLAMMLGSRRPGVSKALEAFQHAGFVRYAHGRITIRDRRGLEEAACECYEVARVQFCEQLGNRDRVR